MKGVNLNPKVDGKGIWGPIGEWGVIVYHFQYFEGILGPFPLFQYVIETEVVEE